jgi:murein DD-endopeptidase / murein LD-carboxypeptidase
LNKVYCMRLVNKEFPFLLLCFLSIAISFSSCHHGKEISKTDKTSEHKNTSSSKKLEQKYASILGVNENKISNILLYSFIDDWYGVPYKYGGNTKKGIDCSNFAATLYNNIYTKKLDGSSASIFNQCKVISKNDLKEGDLLFFKIDNENISHIGVYLQNNKFVHATTKKGVMIDDLDEPYYKKYFFKAGRLL